MFVGFFSEEYVNKEKKNKVCFGIQHETSEEKTHVKPRIAGGFQPPVHTLAKYIVSIRKRDEPFYKFGYTHFCGGSIISPNKILTAAHCVFNEHDIMMQPSLLKIVAKTPKRLEKTNHTQEINVKKVIAHYSFRRNELFHDIAILILEHNIILDDLWAASIRLPSENLQVGAVCTVIGWGKLYKNGPVANNIIYAELTIQSESYCRSRFPFIITKKMCATDTNDIEKDACNGDSGGPLFCNGILTGIVSYGFGCGGGLASIYTNVFKYMDWIARGHSTFWKSLKILHLLTLALIVFS